MQERDLRRQALCDYSESASEDSSVASSPPGSSSLAKSIILENAEDATPTAVETTPVAPEAAAPPAEEAVPPAVVAVDAKNTFGQGH